MGSFETWNRDYGEGITLTPLGVTIDSNSKRRRPLGPATLFGRISHGVPAQVARLERRQIRARADLAREVGRVLASIQMSRTAGHASAEAMCQLGKLSMI